MTENDLKKFWSPLNNTSRLLSNKTGVARFSYLLLLHHFKYSNTFFKTLSDIPDGLIEFGLQHIEPALELKTLQEFFSDKVRLIYMYKDEIRKHFDVKKFSEISSEKFIPLLSDLLCTSLNDEVLKEGICKFLIAEKVEIPEENIISALFKKIKFHQESTIFNKIQNILSTDHKQWIDNYLLSSNEFGGVCQFLRQDSAASNRDGIRDELKRLDILRILPLDHLHFINAIPAKHRSVLKRRFLSNTLQQMKDKSDLLKYGLATLFCYQRYQLGIDNLADHLLNVICNMTKQSERKKAALTREIANKINDLSDLYKIAEIARDQPHDIIEDAIYTSVPLETIEQLLKIKKLSHSITKVVNSLLEKRDLTVWGILTTSCGSDSTEFDSFDQNLMAQWHPRYNETGVMIYWHVNSQYICINSQLKTCSSSEVAAMLQGVINHGTDMDIKFQYVDTHGKSELGFALTYLLGFELFPRYKIIGSQKLYLSSDDFALKNINEITTRSIDWSLIEDQYDEMVKHAVAIKIGTSTADSIIRKFAKSNYKHPTFKAFLELGKVVKTKFLCRYLNSVEMRREVNTGLNVVENWNGANNFIYYGKSGEIPSNSRDEQELSMLCLHLLQISVTYVNTLFVQQVFKEESWGTVFKDEDFRALTPLFYHHINPYGTFKLDLKTRLDF